MGSLASWLAKNKKVSHSYCYLHAKHNIIRLAKSQETGMSDFTFKIRNPDYGATIVMVKEEELANEENHKRYLFRAGIVIKKHK